MKVVRPTRLLAEAAAVLEPVREEVVVVGATALEVALSDAESVAITPTRDVDVVVPSGRVGEVVDYMETSGLHRSELPHERNFTWVRQDLKVQLVRTFHPFAQPPAKALPANPVFGMATDPANQLPIAFVDAPGAIRLVCANAACVLALKQAAFGRTRGTDGVPVERDFHDAYLLISAVPDDIVRDLSVASYEVITRVTDRSRSSPPERVRPRLPHANWFYFAALRRSATQRPR